MGEFIIFIEENKLNFSKKFKQELSQQLLELLEINLDSKKLLDKHFFALLINGNDSQIQKTEDYAYMNVDILSPDSMARSITIGWNSETIPEIQKIHTNLNDDDKIDFFYFTDLPIEELKYYLKKKQNIKNAINPNFEYRINYENFPDLTMKIGAKNELTALNISEINKTVTEKISQLFPNCWHSPFSNNSINFDFQIDSSKFQQTDLEFVEKLFNEIITQISQSDFKEKIEYIIVE